ncbi:hypothetical protein M8312_10310 [Sphingomonas sp. KRR8]|uniref:hypothetical protein n=1 Tax=Sphingomonas sp. KRR8 TaxID=2942996 RepID=UPI00201FCAF4|nr:hypothetical protein [Sphingomonas sp. KRR8]URD60179.1 hypothetical protein M8312_10310 [Sphingomonas sp. KRR8]
MRNRQKRGGRWLPRFFLALLGLLVVGLPTPAAAQEKFVKIGNLTDYNFGTITNLSADRTLASSICVYSAKTTPGYNVTASGNGAGGAFTLAGGGGTLAYEVQWNQAPNMASGTTLRPNVPLTGLLTTAIQANCNNGPPSSASLIVVLRAAALQAAPSGTFSGVLTIIIGSE